jgi:hypothetical protein
VPGDHRVKRDNSSSHLRPLKSRLPDCDCRSTRLHSPPLAFYAFSFLTSAATLEPFLSLPLNLTAQKSSCAASPTPNQPFGSASSTELFLSSDCPHPASHLSRPSTSGSLLFLGRIGFLICTSRNTGEQFCRSQSNSFDALPEEVPLATIE